MDFWSFTSLFFDMDVNFSGFTACVAQQFLYVAQVSPFFERVCGRRVAQGVRDSAGRLLAVRVGAGKDFLCTVRAIGSAMGAFEEVFSRLVNEDVLLGSGLGRKFEAQGVALILTLFGSRWSIGKPSMWVFGQFFWGESAQVHERSLA